MKLIDRETVGSVSIGRRVQYRRGANGVRSERAGREFLAVFRAPDGRQRTRSLETTDKAEALRKAAELDRTLREDAAAVQGRMPDTRCTMAELLDGYADYSTAKGLAPKTQAKYKAEIDKIRMFVHDADIHYADQFDDPAYHKYGSWLRARPHKQGTGYAGKSVYTSLTVLKQVFKFGLRARRISDCDFLHTKLPPNRARPQPCFTEAELMALVTATEGETQSAIVVLAFTGLRIGELEQLQWSDVRMDLASNGAYGMLHIRRGGSADTTKTGAERFVPINEGVHLALENLSRTSERVFPGIKARTLLATVKRLCREHGFDERLKLHSFRHLFASKAANSRIPYRMALKWMGHSSSSILNLYYHLSDDESQAAMAAMSQQQRS